MIWMSYKAQNEDQSKSDLRNRSWRQRFKVPRDRWKIKLRERILKEERLKKKRPFERRRWRKKQKNSLSLLPLFDVEWITWISRFTDPLFKSRRLLSVGDRVKLVKQGRLSAIFNRTYKEWRYSCYMVWRFPIEIEYNAKGCGGFFCLVPLEQIVGEVNLRLHLLRQGTWLYRSNSRNHTTPPNWERHRCGNRRTSCR